MAKGYKKVEVIIPEKQKLVRNGIGEFTNSVGVTVKLRAVPPMEITRIQESVSRPKVPTYSVPTAAGTEEIYPHDSTTLVTDEDKKAWEKYQEMLAEAEEQLTLKILRCVLIEGVVVTLEDEPVKRWKKRQELMGLDVSDDEEEMLLHYKDTEVIRNQDDMEEILSRVMALSGITEETLDVARKSFPGKVESSPPTEPGNEPSRPED